MGVMLTLLLLLSMNGRARVKRFARLLPPLVGVLVLFVVWPLGVEVDVVLLPRRAVPKPDDLLRLAEALAGEVSERAGGAPSYVYCCKLAAAAMALLRGAALRTDPGDGATVAEDVELLELPRDAAASRAAFLFSLSAATFSHCRLAAALFLRSNFWSSS